MEEPERAINLVDSAVIVGSLDKHRADYLKAVVLFNALNNTDSCIKICEQLINDESWSDRIDTGTVVTKVDICRLIATAATEIGNHQLVLRYASEGIKLAHGDKMYLGDEADLLSRLGYTMFLSGQKDEGLAKMYNAEKLTKGSSSWPLFLAYLNNAKKLYKSLVSVNRYDQSKNVVLAALNRLEEVSSNPEKIEDLPGALSSDSNAFKSFVDVYKSPFYAYLTNVSAITESDSTEMWLQRFRSTSLSDKPDYSQSIIHPLLLMGKYDEARKRIAEVKEQYGCDTICKEYVELLNEEKLLERRSGNLTAESNLSNQIISINDSLSTRQYHQVLAEYATQYQLQEEKLKHEDAERHLLIVIISLMAFLLIVVVVLSVNYIRKAISNKKKLQEQIVKAQVTIDILRESQNEDDDTRCATPEEIYEKAVFVMKQYQLYKDPSFDINMLSQQLMINKGYLSAAINQLANMNFRSWLAKFRVEEAKRILAGQPEIKAEELAALSGFDNRVSLYRQFKNIEGMTPAEWISARS